MSTGNGVLNLNQKILAWPNLEKSGLSKLCWLHLWHDLAGEKAGIVSVSAAAIAATIGVGDRSARKALENLKSIHAIEVLDRNLMANNNLRGSLVIHVFRPDQVPMSQPPGVQFDPQMALIEGAVEPHFIPVRPAICAHKSPEICAHKSPDAQPGEARQPQTQKGETPSKVPREPAICARKSPDVPMVSLERSNYISPNLNLGSQRTKGFTRDLGCGRVASVRGEVAEALGDRGLRLDEPVQAAEVLAEAIYGHHESQAWRKKRKDDLVQYLVAMIGDPSMDRSIPAKAAEAVLDHGFSLQELEVIAEATARKRKAEQLVKSPRAYFRARCIKAGMTGMDYKRG
jgi:hypothetical protein